MCGINGIFGTGERNSFVNSVSLMNKCLAHRGPDDEGLFDEENIAFGHRRLSIIDLSKLGHQPMFSTDNNLVIVYNGELYNYTEIKKQLVDYPFKTNSDTEVILASYAKWGKDCLQHFNGMFAFAIWDKTAKKLFIARDRLGIKPLYYHADEKNKVLTFSSELRAILGSGNVKRKLDENSLVDYLRYQTVYAPNTIVENVKMLLPGHYLFADLNGIEIKKYWDLNEKYDNKVADQSYSEICKHTRRLLLNAVERRLISDVPFGAFLSGGIDSSAIVGLMSEVMSKSPDTFSVTFDEEEFSEAKYAQMVAKKFNTRHHEIKLKVADFIGELPSALHAIDFPSGDGPNTYIVSKATKEAGITMALSGLGGDELFAGYEVFTRTARLNKLNLISSLPIGLRRQLAKLLTINREGISSDKLIELMSEENFDIANTYYLSRRMLLDKQVKNILRTKELPGDFVKNMLTQVKWPFDNDFLLSKVSYAEINTYMQNVLLRDTDQMSMAHALEVRVPFLDYKLVEYVYSVPDKYKYPATPKKLLIDSLNELLPREIVNRPKMGFTLPWNNWLRNELKSFCEEKINSFASRKMINSAGILHLWNSFLKNDNSVQWSRIWYLIVLENWLQQNKIEE